MPTARRHGGTNLHHPPARAFVTTTVFGAGIVLEFDYLLFDSSPISIAKDAPSSNEMSTNLFQGSGTRAFCLAPHAFLGLFKLECGNVLIFQVAARPRDSLREFQLSDD